MILSGDDLIDNSDLISDPEDLYNQAHFLDCYYPGSARGISSVEEEMLREWLDSDLSTATLRKEILPIKSLRPLVYKREEILHLAGMRLGVWDRVWSDFFKSRELAAYELWERTASG